MSIAVKERPLPCLAHEVRAILSGAKSQTRRVVKLPKERGDWEPIAVGGPGVFASNGEPAPKRNCIWNTKTGKCLACPHGDVGDRLWVRETFAVSAEPSGWEGHHWLTYDASGDRIEVDCSEIAMGRLKPGKRYPSIHMPRWASRITLEITDVRVERLQDISEADVEAEGCDVHFGTLWDSINGLGSWNDNPYVWAISFRRVEPQP